MTQHEQDMLKRIRAICDLANANFPSTSDITISCGGQCSGSVKIPAYALLNLLKPTPKATP